MHCKQKLPSFHSTVDFFSFLLLSPACYFSSPSFPSSFFPFIYSFSEYSQITYNMPSTVLGMHTDHMTTIMEFYMIVGEMNNKEFVVISAKKQRKAGKRDRM